MNDGPERREHFPFRIDIPTRWNDNDMFGHVNNALYNSFFEAVVVRFLTDEVRLDLARTDVFPYAVETLCRFHRSLSFPDVVEGCLRVVHVGNSSVVYELALFAGDNPDPAATGRFVQVFVDPETERSAGIPEAIRTVYEAWLRR